MPAFAGIWLAIVTISVNVVRADTAASAPSGFFRSSGVNDVLASQAEPLIRQTSEIDDPLASPPLPSPAEATASFEYPALEEQFTATPDFPNEQPDFASRVIGSCEPCCSPTHEVMPVGLLYRSYIAAPHEPRMSSTLLYDTSAHESRWDSTLGGRIGLYRRNNPDNMNLDAWQIDVEGAVMVRLDPGEQMDLESSDYRFGLLWTGRRDNISYKAGYFHISSHVGDEYQIKNPLFQRINFVRESLIVGTAIQMTPEVRTYIEAAYAVAYHGGAKPFQVQYGAEYVRVPCRPGSKTPFVAANFQHRQEVDFEAGINLMTGYQWTGPNTGRTMRIGLQYFNGPTNQYQFIGRYDNQLGFGIWVDY
ncbi:MAG: DUF1207 domain-containing protein [Planctomycetaceae bacterium]